jgi:ribosomal protein RSM22 (predicted rRNA methylase)
MQLPPALREGIDRELEGVSLRDLARVAETLSLRYRAEVQDDRLHLDDEPAARAYLTTRLPATFAAIAAALGAVVEAKPAFAPRTMLDAGAGPGTATWAAAQYWGSLRDALLIEASPVIRAIGERLLRPLALDQAAWLSARLDSVLSDLPPCDLVLIAYVLDELPPAAREPMIAQLWRLTADTLVIVEPGTPEGWKRILQARNLLIRAGAHLLAPCPHSHPCPLAPPDWCHFPARVARSRRHREAKGGTVPWEDEKFIYLAASRAAPLTAHLPRVIEAPRTMKAAVALKLCLPEGGAARQSVGKRDGDAFKVAQKRRWGDTLPFTSGRP